MTENTLEAHTRQRLIEASRKARDNAYAPYSGYAVGAAVLTDTGKIFSGCNVENASYGLTVCAERVAVSSAVAAGCRHFTAIAISLTGIAVPCGSCRQFLHEFNPDMFVLLDDLSAPKAEPEQVRLSELLPRAFRLTD
ncbi:MAG: cytidine deaminase [Planctomycetaceae bacterium]|nr:cytidine deaminase [Planctomycetaceae bacterium]